MTKIKNNPIMKGASGMLGDTVVYREHRGKVIMSNRPKTGGILTPNQERAKSRFKSAVAYAKLMTADPVTKAEYQPSKTSKFTSAYSVALTDFLTAPKVNLIDAGRYGGQIGDEILIKAVDDFKVTQVQISIFAAGGNLLEQGVVALVPGTVEDFLYTATVANALLPGTKIVVTVRDKAGNVTTEEKIL